MHTQHSCVMELSYVPVQMRVGKTQMYNKKCVYNVYTCVYKAHTCVYKAHTCVYNCVTAAAA